MLLWFFLFIVVLFHREILSSIVSWMTAAEETSAPRAELTLKAHFNSVPRIFLMKKPITESLGISFLLKKQVFVAEEFWNELSDLEREALLCWYYAALEKILTIGRIAGPFSFESIDRDVLVTARDPLAWVKLMEKAVAFRAKTPPSGLGTLLGGLSLLGPSLLMETMNEAQRRKAYADRLTKLQQ